LSESAAFTESFAAAPLGRIFLLVRVGARQQSLKALRRRGLRRRAGVLHHGQAALLDDLIETRQCAHHRIGLISNLEFEERLLFDELAGALRVLNTGDLHHDAVGSLLLHDRFRNAEALDAGTNGLQRAIDRFNLLIGGNRLLGVVDLEREVGAAFEIESLVERNTAIGDVVQQAVRPALTHRDIAREEEPQRHEHEAQNREYAILQGHTTAGRR